MYGVPQFAQAAAKVGLKTVFGAELSLDLPRRKQKDPDPGGRHLLVLARDAEGYRRLCAAISEAQLAGGEKNRPVYAMDDLAQRHDGHWVILTGCRKGHVPAALAGNGPGNAREELRKLTDMFGQRNVMVELNCHNLPGDDERNDALAALAAASRVPVIATGNVHFAAPPRAQLGQTLAAIRARRSLAEVDGWLAAAGTSYLRSGDEMSLLLKRYPGVFERTMELAGDCAFGFDVIAPKLPDYPVPGTHTEATWLRHLAAEGAAAKYKDNQKAHAQIAKELDVIERLHFPGYFLIVHDIVRFCERNRILCQGRGSAANSAVCYAIGITSVDPVEHGLLFERFLSDGRDGPPDIDLDIEHRRREEAIQYVYGRYGRRNAAQVANVISYRPRMALRDAGRAFGYSQQDCDGWVHQISPGGAQPGESLPGESLPGESLPGESLPEQVPPQVMQMARQMQRLPRHLGIHSGGMVICDRPVGEVCPVEWARMPNRSVLQWDKDDCAYAGLVKFDLLGLGMLSALRDCFDLVQEHHGDRYDLHSLPQNDEAVYDMVCAADTVGVFQVESRAQMATLPRLKPRTFYDLVIDVALIRPGPIQGGSVHPFIRRHEKLEPVVMPHPLMKNALDKTLGVPLFQEQMMQLAIDCAGFSPTEADQLRQAMSSKRSSERILELRHRLLEGMGANGIPVDVAEDIYQKILAFSSYGFPESHAISFAYLVYASAYLKRYYPAAFTCALLRNQPMGFYAPHSLISDARRHGVTVLGVDVNASDALATLDGSASQGGGEPSIRLGISSVRNLGPDAASRVAAGRPYRDLTDFAARTQLKAAALEALATAGAFGCFGLSRRAALWAAGAAANVRDDQLPGTTAGLTAPSLPDMTPVEETLADLWATGTYGTHPVAHIRSALRDRGVLSASEVRAAADGSAGAVAGLVTHRQRPPTAGGVVFMTLEDETGMVNVVCPPQVWELHKRMATVAPALIIGGRIERSGAGADGSGGAVNLIASALRPLKVAATVPSRDFRLRAAVRDGLASRVVSRPVQHLRVLERPVLRAVDCHQPDPLNPAARQRHDDSSHAQRLHPGHSVIRVRPRGAGCPGDVAGCCHARPTATRAIGRHLAGAPWPRVKGYRPARAVDRARADEDRRGWRSMLTWLEPVGEAVLAATVERNGAGDLAPRRVRGHHPDGMVRDDERDPADAVHRDRPQLQQVAIGQRHRGVADVGLDRSPQHMDGPGAGRAEAGRHAVRVRRGAVHLPSRAAERRAAHVDAHVKLPVLPGRLAGRQPPARPVDGALGDLASR
jgi:error-prone DNA polymerase